MILVISFIYHAHYYHCMIYWYIEVAVGHHGFAIYRHLDNIKLGGSISGRYQWPNRVMPEFNFPPTLRELCKGQLGLDQWFWVGAYFLLIASQMFNFQVCSQCWEVSVEHGFTFCGNLSPLSLSIVNVHWKTFAPTQNSCTVMRIMKYNFWDIKDLFCMGDNWRIANLVVMMVSTIETEDMAFFSAS